MSIETIPHNMTQRASIRAEHQWFAEDVEHVTLSRDCYHVRHALGYASPWRVIVPHECIVLA